MSHLIKTVLEDAYLFLSQVVLLEFDEASMDCKCSTVPEDYTFNTKSRLASRKTLDEVSFTVNLNTKLVDVQSVKVNESLIDI